jgi:hypothetical protein
LYVPPTDKLLHLAAGAMCALAGLALGQLARLLGFSGSALLAGVLVCAAAAIAREAWNLRQGGLFDWRDIAATLGGGALVAAAFWLGGGR